MSEEEKNKEEPWPTDPTLWPEPFRIKIKKGEEVASVPVIRPIRDLVVVEFDAKATSPGIEARLVSKKIVTLEDSSHADEDSWNKYKFTVTPIQPTELDIVCIDVKLVTRPGVNSMGFIPETWLGKVKVGYGWGPESWVKLPLYSWDRKILSSMHGLVAYKTVLDKLGEMVKEHPGLARELMQDFREYTRRMADKHDDVVDFLKRSPKDSLTLALNTWYTMNVTDHRARARHCSAGEELHLYVEPEDLPQQNVTFAIIIGGMTYTKVS